MSPKGEIATKRADAPNNFYDSLSQPEQDAFDRSGACGFRPERDENGRWIGLSTTADDRLGPFPTIEELAIAAEKFFEANGGKAIQEADLEDSAATPEDEPQQQGGNVVKIKQNAKGQQYLDGQEPEIDPEVATAAGEYHSFKMERVNLQNKEKVAKEKLIAVVNRKKHLFETDPDNSNAKIYEISPELRVRAQKDWTESITTEDPRNAKRKGKKAA